MGVKEIINHFDRVVEGLCPAVPALTKPLSFLNIGSRKHTQQCRGIFVDKSLKNSACITLMLLTSCATGPQVHVVSSFLVSSESLAKGKRTPATTFTLEDVVRFYVDIRWDDATKDLGLYHVTFKWSQDSKVLSSAIRTYRFNTTPFELWTQRAASALGVGHFRVEVLVGGEVLASKEFDITS
jgi:hypothetical protein